MKTDLKPVTRTRPCAVCGGDHKCARGADGLFLCGRAAGPVDGFAFLGPAPKDPQWNLYQVAGTAPPGAGLTRPARPAPAVDWNALAARLAFNLTDDIRYDLAFALVLPVDALDALPGVGYATAEGCWTFPEADPDGRVVGLNRRFRDGTKKVMAGGARGLTLPAGWAARPGPVLLVEGASDTLTLTRCGLAAVGRPSNTGGVELLADLLRDLDPGRAVIVVGENDQKPDGKWPGRDGAERTAAGLTARLDRPVGWALTPDEVKDPRAWVLDQAAGAGEVVDWPAIGRAFVAAVTAGVTTGPGEPRPTAFPPPAAGERWNAPHRLARLFVAATTTPGGEPTVVRWRDEFYRWADGAYRPVSDATLEAELARHGHQVFTADYAARVATAEEGERPAMIYPVTTQVVANTRVNLAGLVHLPDGDTDPPFWLDPAVGRPPAVEVLAAPNGLFTLADVAAGRGPFAAPTPAFFTPTALPFPVAPTAPRPAAWLAALDQWFDRDVASIAGLQEVFGYLLSADTSAQKIFLLVGPPRSGKGTILHVLTELVGMANVAATSFATLGENFGLEGLLGKTVAVIPDARLSGRTDLGAVVEKLLSISGQDPQAVDRKHRRPVSARLRARFVIATNELPRLPDASGALASRFQVFRTPNSWLGKEDPGLRARLAAERPGILLWAAAGWVRLRGRGGMRFTPNDAAREYHQELADLSSPLRAFVRECCAVGPDYRIERPELYAAWREWNADRNREVSSENIFGRDLRAVLPHLRGAQTNRVGERRKRLYVGVGLKPRWEWGDDDPDV